MRRTLLLRACAAAGTRRRRSWWARRGWRRMWRCTRCGTVSWEVEWTCVCKEGGVMPVWLHCEGLGYSQPPMCSASPWSLGVLLIPPAPSCCSCSAAHHHARPATPRPPAGGRPDRPPAALQGGCQRPGEPHERRLPRVPSGGRGGGDRRRQRWLQPGGGGGYAQDAAQVGACCGVGAHGGGRLSLYV